jgi:hypothetical protein
MIRQDVEKNYNRLDVRATQSRRNPYYGNYVQQKCNRLDSRATLSRHSPEMETRGVRDGKSVAQFTFRTLSATVWTTPREIFSDLF